MANKIEQWMKEAAAACKRVPSHPDGCKLATESGAKTREELFSEVIAAHVPAPSDLERRVREKWEAWRKGKCQCTAEVLCDACRANHAFGEFSRHNARDIAEALVARLPKEEK